jgi:hypothetical protein
MVKEEEMKVVTEGTGECRKMDGSGTVPKRKNPTTSALPSDRVALNAI